MSSSRVVSRWSVYGLTQSIRGAKFPMATDVSILTGDMTKGIKALAQTPPGEGHDQWLTRVIVQFDLTFSIKAWTEAQRYHFFDFVSSQSTMHRINRFNLEDSYDDHTDPRSIEIVRELVERFNKTEDPEDFLRVIMSNPCGMRLTARMTTNYRQLKTIYRQRKTHRLPEWREFCGWIEQLPMAELITGQEKDPCETCHAYGDDYYITDDGEVGYYCDDCWVTKEGLKRGD